MITLSYPVTSPTSTVTIRNSPNTADDFQIDQSLVSRRNRAGGLITGRPTTWLDFDSVRVQSIGNSASVLADFRSLLSASIGDIIKMTVVHVDDGDQNSINRVYTGMVQDPEIMLTTISGDGCKLVNIEFNLLIESYTDYAIPSLTVSGTLIPDAAGWYVEDGVYAEKPAYRRNDSAYWIWWVDPTAWIISTGKTIETAPFWAKFDANVVGEYLPGVDTTGTATVSLTS